MRLEIGDVPFKPKDGIKRVAGRFNYPSMICLYCSTKDFKKPAHDVNDIEREVGFDKRSEVSDVEKEECQISFIAKRLRGFTCLSADIKPDVGLISYEAMHADWPAGHTSLARQANVCGLQFSLTGKRQRSLLLTLKI